MDIYRFRSTENLLGEHRELHFQSIYFANPHELNDPTDGYRDIIWRGDAIVWSNLFKHYIYCVNNIYYKYVILPNKGQPTIEPADIPIDGRWDTPSTPEQDAIFRIVCHAAFGHLGLAGAAQELQNSNNEVRRDDLQAYLDWLNRDLLGLLKGVYEHYSALTHDTTLPPFDPRGLNFPNYQYKPLSHLVRILHGDQEEPEIDTADLLNRIVSSSLRAKYYIQDKFGEEVNKLAEKVSFDITRDYLDRLPELLIPEWSTACFTTKHNDSTMWSNYADDHKGICLMFQSHTVPNRESTPHMILLPTFELAQQAPSGDLSTSDIEHLTSELHRVRYVASQNQLDFFANLVSLPPATLMKLWYTDDNGNSSNLSSHIDEDEFDEEWAENYHDNFWEGILSKNEVWSDECEYRLVTTPVDAFHFKEKSKTLHYRFEDLKGIIFGMRTSDEDKIEVMKSIQRKCREHERSEFNLYQAHYSEGQIQRRPIDFDWR